MQIMQGTATIYLLIALIMAVESFGIPFPTAVAYILGVALMERAGSSIAVVVGVLTALVFGQMAGSMASYCLGTTGQGWLISMLKSTKRFKSVYDRVDSFYRRYGILSVFICRLVGYLRPWISVVSGILKMRFVPFVLATLLGSITFSVFTLWLFYQGYALYRLSKDLHLWIVLVAMLLIVIALLAYLWLRRKSK